MKSTFESFCAELEFLVVLNFVRPDIVAVESLGERLCDVRVVFALFDFVEQLVNALLLFVFQDSKDRHVLSTLFAIGKVLFWQFVIIESVVQLFLLYYMYNFCSFLHFITFPVFFYVFWCSWVNFVRNHVHTLCCSYSVLHI